MTSGGQLDSVSTNHIHPKHIFDVASMSLPLSLMPEVWTSEPPNRLFSSGMDKNARVVGTNRNKVERMSDTGILCREFAPVRTHAPWGKKNPPPFHFFCVAGKGAFPSYLCVVILLHLCVGCYYVLVVSRLIHHGRPK